MTAVDYAEISILTHAYTDRCAQCTHCTQLPDGCVWVGGYLSTVIRFLVTVYGWVFSVSTLVRDVRSVIKFLVAVSGWISCVAACVVSTCVLNVPSVLKLLVAVSG